MVESAGVNLDDYAAGWWLPIVIRIHPGLRRNVDRSGGLRDSVAEPRQVGRALVAHIGLRFFC
jgi:hypothetical protein